MQEASDGKVKKMQISGAILAGGKGSRIGGVDKQGILFEGRPLGRRLAMELEKLADEIVVVGSNPQPYEGIQVRFAQDLMPGYGPLSGLHAALACAAFDWVYLVACDMPFISPQWFRYLRSVAERLGESPQGRPRALIASDGSHVEPFHALYSKSFLSHLEYVFRQSRPEAGPISFSKALAGTPRLEVSQEIVRGFSPDWSLFASVNTTADLDLLARRG